MLSNLDYTYVWESGFVSTGLKYASSWCWPYFDLAVAVSILIFFYLGVFFEDDVHVSLPFCRNLLRSLSNLSSVHFLDTRNMMLGKF